MQVYPLICYDHHYICFLCFSWVINIDDGALLVPYAYRISYLSVQSLFWSIWLGQTQFDHVQQVVLSDFGFDGSILCSRNLLVPTIVFDVSVFHYILRFMVIFIYYYDHILYAGHGWAYRLIYRWIHGMIVAAYSGFKLFDINYIVR